MMTQEKTNAVAEGKWIGWPTEVHTTDLLQPASDIIATTRYQWADRGAADDPAGNCGPVKFISVVPPRFFRR